MKITAMQIIVGAIGTISKEMIKELEYLEIREQLETIKTTAFFLRSSRILRFLET